LHISYVKKITAPLSSYFFCRIYPIYIKKLKETGGLIFFSQWFIALVSFFIKKNKQTVKQKKKKITASLRGG